MALLWRLAVESLPPGLYQFVGRAMFLPSPFFYAVLSAVRVGMA